MTMARPTKLQDERRERILTAIREGNTRRAAAALGGIGERTLYDWIAKDEQFSQDVIKAEGEAEAEMVSRVHRAALDGSWQAAAWWLERRRPGEFGRKDLPAPNVTVKMVDDDNWRGNGRERPTIAHDSATHAS